MASTLGTIAFPVGPSKCVRSEGQANASRGYANGMRTATAATAALIAATLIGGVRAGAQPDPYSVYDRARHIWQTQHYPAFLSYTVGVYVDEGGVAKSRHYHLTYDAQNDLIDVNPVSDEEHAAPPSPTGFVLHLLPKRQGHVLMDKKVGNPGEAVDYLGVPKISPTYAFGLNSAVETQTGEDSDALVAQIRKDFHDPVPVQKAEQAVTGGPLKTIAVVSTRSRAYTIAMNGIEPVDGHDCYHLALQPNRDPQKLRLREVWVDTQSYQTRQILTAGNFTGTGARWLVHFVEIGGAMYIGSESALGSVGVGPHRYDKATVAFEEIAPAQRPAHQSSFFATNQNVFSEPSDGNNPH